LIRATFTATTDAHARRHHKISAGDHRCFAHCDMLTQQRNARDTFASDEQAGNMTRIPELSAKRTMLPVRSVPSSDATSDASISKKTLAKNAKSTRLHSIGTVSANSIRAPRLREE